MKLRILKTLWLFAICYLPVAAFGQGSCSPDKIALLDTGRPAGGASIRVCTAGSTGTPCTPAASLFTDPTLGTPLGGSPVVTADARGNWGFCAAAGALYDYQISCTGCTTLTVKNFPLPPTTPIMAASLTSSSANPASVGLIKLASGDCLDWRNNANSGNIQLCKTGAAAGGVPADTFDMTAGGAVEAQRFVGATASPAQSGVVACANNVVCVAARNAANGADIPLAQLDASNVELLGAPIRIVEVAAPAGVASSDVLYPDSTAHRWKVNNNNGGAKTLANTDGDTLTNTALTGPSISDPSITGVAAYKRIKATNGNAVVVGDFALSAGWGNTATKDFVVGSDGFGRVGFTANGTGIAANPTITFTFHDGAWINTPICSPLRADIHAPQNILFGESSNTTTQIVWTFQGTPTAGNQYALGWQCQDR